MRTIQGARAGGLVAALAVVLVAGVARADVTTERPGSILIFPKVVRDGARETTIQITNTGNMPDTVRCFYLNAQAQPGGQPACVETDFFLSLTKQQPTQWNVSTGRAVNQFDGDRGLDPGSIPPAPLGFVGALICAEVDAFDKPVAQNQLKGEATLSGVPGSPGQADISKYNALAVQGNGAAGANDGDDALELNRDANNLGGEYNACPAATVLNFEPDGSTDPVIESMGTGGTCAVTGTGCNNDADCTGTCDVAGTGLCTAGAVGRACVADADCGLCTTGQSSVVTTLTVLPCNLDLANNRPTQATVQFSIHNELEIQTSVSTTVTCWGSFALSDISGAFAAGGAFATPFETARMVSVNGGPVVSVLETFRTDAAGNRTAAANNVHTQGVCSGFLSGPTVTTQPIGCLTDADCPAAQTCVLTQSATIQLPPH
jgi:hypothetical protein